MKGYILLLIMLGPMLINLLLIFIAQSFFLGNKIMLSMLVVIYLLLNCLLPFLIGEDFLIDKANDTYYRELLALILLILIFRMIDIFRFGLGKVLKMMWNNNKQGKSMGSDSIDL
jgi:hypothetical protein